MAKDFKCEVCRKTSERLHMRDSDGRWVCAHCIPERELAACPGLRERLGLQPARAAQPRKKAA
jgi:ribosomal protein L37AE/L43A